MIHNFYAGPSIIAPEVLQQASEDILHRDDLLSVIEISHRSQRFDAIVDELYSLTRELLSLNDDFDLCFLQGGARQQFYQIPFNLSEMFQSNCYVDTGTWSSQALKESSFFGNTEVIASSKDEGYKSIPSIAQEPENSNYVYVCSNNTIYGTQYKEYPKTNAPLIADMSSDLMSANIDFNQFGLFYAATQKNAGTAGACLVAVKRDLLKKEKGSLPTMVDYRTHINKKSLYNTPPVFAFYMTLLTFRWVKEKGGLAYFDQYNKEKAQILYDELDRNELFIPYAHKDHRSVMNATFTAISPEIENRFKDFALQQNILGINGHRSVGGFRASMYNAMPKESVAYLVDVMQEFERKG